MSTANINDINDIDDFLKSVPQVQYTNAPTTLDEAITRLARAEFLLADLANAAEIAEIVNDSRLTNVYRTQAEEYLLTKLVKQEKLTNNMPITILV